MSTSSETLCPCCSQKPYNECCQPLHQGEKQATTPEQLMRSRYSAFAKHKIDYLLQTTHSSIQSSTDKTSLTRWATENHWEKLEIIRFSENESNGVVEFKAYFHTYDTNEIHHELSEFVKEDGRWYYSKGTIDPIIDASIKRNDPCPGGSGKKYKKCCDQ